MTQYNGPLRQLGEVAREIGSLCVSRHLRACQARCRLTISTRPAPVFFMVGASMVVWLAACRLGTARIGAETTSITIMARGSSLRHLRVSFMGRVMIFTALSSVLCQRVQSWFTDRQKISWSERQKPAPAVW